MKFNQRLFIASGFSILALLSAGSFAPAQDHISRNSNLPAETYRTRSDGAGIVRTLAYHEITLFASRVFVTGSDLILSASGNRAAYSYAPGTQDPNTPNRIFVINADGSDQREIDFYTTLCFCGSDVDISADGSKVISSE